MKIFLHVCQLGRYWTPRLLMVGPPPTSFYSTSLWLHAAHPAFSPFCTLLLLIPLPGETSLCLTPFQTLIMSKHVLHLSPDGRASGNPSLPTSLLLGLGQMPLLNIPQCPIHLHCVCFDALSSFIIHRLFVYFYPNCELLEGGDYTYHLLFSSP